MSLSHQGTPEGQSAKRQSIKLCPSVCSPAPTLGSLSSVALSFGRVNIVYVKEQYSIDGLTNQDEACPGEDPKVAKSEGVTLLRLVFVERDPGAFALMGRIKLSVTEKDRATNSSEPISEGRHATEGNRNINVLVFN